MPSLRDHLGSVPAIRSRSVGAWLAPALRETAPAVTPRVVEEAAATVLAHVLRGGGPIREALIADRRRFERLTVLVYRLPDRRGGRR